MSVIVAIKENGVIYMGADSQSSMVSSKCTRLNEIGFKITRFANGVLVGFCGRAATAQAITAMPDLFVLDEQGKLTKKHIVTQIIPKIVGELDQLGDEEYGTIEVSMLIAHQDQLYRITDELDVIHINNAVSIGAGMHFTNYALFCMTDVSVRDRILSALRESANWVESVGGPFVLIDTQTLQYEIVE